MLTEITVIEISQHEESTFNEFVQSDDHVEPQDGDAENYVATQSAGDSPAPAQYLYKANEQPSQESTSAGTIQATSLTTSFTSSFSAQSQGSSKRNRASNRPPSNVQARKKHDMAKRRTHQRTS